MASVKKRLSSNITGEFFVDSTCIDCAACRWIAPEVFDEADGYSRVHAQPESPAQELAAEMALLACPTGSIGAGDSRDLSKAQASYPNQVAGNVYHCGYHARSSYGAASYLVVRPEGNVLIDSPRFTAPLVRRIEEMGGVRTMILTHRDDVADHEKFRGHFGCERVLHEDDVEAETEGVERKPAGMESVLLDRDLTLIPVPGHTRGSICILYKEFLFTGDHLAWDSQGKRLYAFRDACWHSWQALGRSMQRLEKYRFEWVLPGHGWPVHLPAPQMADEMRRCVQQTAA